MEEIPEPEGGPWAKVGTHPDSKKRPGLNFLAWLAVVAVAACLKLLRSAADRASAAGMPWGGTRWIPWRFSVRSAWPSPPWPWYCEGDPESGRPPSRDRTESQYPRGCGILSRLLDAGPGRPTTGRGLCTGGGGVPVLTTESQIPQLPSTGLPDDAGIQGSG